MVICSCKKCGCELHILDFVCVCGEHRPRQVHPFYMSLATIFIGLPIILIIWSGITNESAPQKNAVKMFLEIPPGTDPRAANVVNAAWPKVLNACPGFYDYVSDLHFQGIDDYLRAAPEIARVDLVFVVDSSPQKIPAAFRADGHTCRFGISPNGRSMRVQKEACVAICTHERVTLGGADYVLPL